MKQTGVEISNMYQQILQSEMCSEKQSWTFSSFKTKERLMKEISDKVVVEYLKQHTDIGVRSEKLLEMEFTAKMIADSSHGFYNGTQILLNPALALNKAQAILTDVHESVHHGQYLFAVTEEAHIPQDLLQKQKAIKDIMYWHESIVFGIETQCAGYVQPDGPPNESTFQKALRQAFYILNVQEREARQIEIDVARKFGWDLKANVLQMQLDESCEILRGAYGCVAMTNEQIYELVDAAVHNVCSGERPKNSREASITYDYAAALFGQSSPKHAKQHQQMTTMEAKSIALHADGFHNAHTIPLQKIDQYSLKQIKELPQVVRDQNPILMTMAVYKYGEDAAKLINHKSYDEWYFSNDNMFDAKVLQRVGEILAVNRDNQQKMLDDVEIERNESCADIDRCSGADIDSIESETYINLDALDVEPSEIDVDGLFEEEDRAIHQLSDSIAYMGCEQEAQDVDIDAFEMSFER